MHTMADLATEFQSLEACCMHEAQWRPPDVKDVVAWRWESPEGYGSEDQVILVRLNDGGYGLLTSSADTTGHGCRCGANTVRAATLHELVRHMTDYELLDLLRDREDAQR